MRVLTKIVFISIMSFSFVLTFAQQADLNPNLITFPVSPEAAKLGSYGNVPVNLFYGLVDKNIELFTGKVGDFSLPINLKYNYAGYRLEEAPSVSGLGWQLNIGGVVTREVKGLPDSYNDNYYSEGYFKTNVWNAYFNTGTMPDLDARKLIEGRYDAEPDKYTLSVNGIHFSFKIGLDGSPVYLSKHSYKVQVNRNPSNSNEIIDFVLTDTNANKYFFEDIETTEQTSGAALQYSNHDILYPGYMSSWQLTKIITNNNTQIDYSYTNNDFNSYNFYGTGVFRGVTDGPMGIDWVTLYNEGCNVFLIKRKLLSSITCNLFKIDFNLSTINNHKVYSEIIVKDYKASTINNYQFTYSGLRNSLVNINKNNKFFEGFEYIGTIPQGFINSNLTVPRNQDKWGFANGATNNYWVNIPNTQYVANKTPSFGTTVIGALSKIIYPTGGETRIVYEQNRVRTTSLSEQDTEPNTRILLKFKSDNISTAPLVKEQVYTKTFDEAVVATLSHKIESNNAGFIYMQIKRIPVGCNNTNSTLYSPTEHYYNKIPAMRSSFNNNKPEVCLILHEELNDGYSGSSAIISRNSGGKFIIPAGTYEFKFHTDTNRYKDVKGEIQLDFYDPTVNPTTATELVGGIRVKQITDVTNGNEVKKYYDYTDKDNNPSGSLYRPLVDIYNYKWQQGLFHYSEGGAFEWVKDTRDVTEFNSKSYNPLLLNGTPVVYSSVKESVIYNDVFTPASPLSFFCTNCTGIYGSNYDGSKLYSYLGGTGTYGTTTRIYPQGYKQTEFSRVERSGNSSQYPFLPEGNNLSIGKQKKHQVYSDTSIQYDETITNTPQYNSQISTNYPKGLVLSYKIKRTGATELASDVHDFFSFHVYNDTDMELFETAKNIKEYYNGQVIEKNKSTVYDIYNQPHLITTSDSQNNILTNEIFHPYDFSDMVSQNMVSKNCISPIVKVENKNNGAVIDTYKYDFGSIGGNLFKPLSFWKSKGGASLEKTMEYSYDTKGNIDFIKNIASDAQSNPLTLSTGPTKTIIWGYNKSQPVAVIENVSGVIPANLITAIQTATDSPTATQANVLTALDNLRNDASMANKMITTYTYIPLVGVSTITDPKGFTSYYEYDSFGRLIQVKDKSGNIVSNNEYHYKN